MQVLTTTESESKSPSREEVLAAIDFELGILDRAGNRRGWTLWAIGGSIVALASFLYRALLGDAEFEECFRIFVCISLAYPFLTSLFTPASDTFREEQNSLRPAAEANRILPQEFILQLLWTLASIIGLVRFSDIIGTLIAAVAGTVLLIGLLLSSLRYLPFLMRFYVPPPPRGLVLGIGLVSSVMMVVPAIMLFPVPVGKYASFEAAIASVAIIVLLRLALRLDPQQFRREKLERLRRDMVIEPMGHIDAKESLKEIIYGKTISQLLDGPLDDYRKKDSQVRNELDTYREHIAWLEAYPSAGIDPSAMQDHLMGLNLSKDRINSLLPGLKAALDKLNDEARKINCGVNKSLANDRHCRLQTAEQSALALVAMCKSCESRIRKWEDRMRSGGKAGAA